MHAVSGETSFSHGHFRAALRKIVSLTAHHESEQPEGPTDQPTLPQDRLLLAKRTTPKNITAENGGGKMFRTEKIGLKHYRLRAVQVSDGR